VIDSLELILLNYGLAGVVVYIFYRLVSNELKELSGEMRELRKEIRALREELLTHRRSF